MSLQLRKEKLDKDGVLPLQIPRTAAEDPLKVSTHVNITPKNTSKERRTHF